jgi:hypothetical protein
MAATTSKPSLLLTLPTELRLAIYHTIIDATFVFEKPQQPTAVETFPCRLPSTSYLRSSSGFILSCQQIKQEFQAEWLTLYNKHIQAVFAPTPFLHVLQFTKLSSRRPMNYLISPTWDWVDDEQSLLRIANVFRHFPRDGLIYRTTDVSDEFEGILYYTLSGCFYHDSRKKKAGRKRLTRL